MTDILIIKKEHAEKLRGFLKSFDVVVYSENSFNRILSTIDTTQKDRVIVVNDFHRDIPHFLNSTTSLNSNEIIKIEPIAFTHPNCHFSGLFLFTVLLLLKRPELASPHSYLISIPSNIFGLDELKSIAREAHTPNAFNSGVLALALHMGLEIRKIKVFPDNPTLYYESLKNEFIHLSAVLMKVLEIAENRGPASKNKEKPMLESDTILKIPGHSFLAREFISGFRKYAPFWKAHLNEDHFALLSSIYAGREDFSIDDRVWIRIMLELLSNSQKYSEKLKIARRIFPIYALYLKSVNESILRDKFGAYMEILEEELKLSN